MSVIIGIGDILSVLDKANWYWIALNFVLEGAIILIWALRWKLILDVVHKAPKFHRIVLMLLASIFGNNITPGAAGGEPLRAYLLTEVEGTPFEIGFATSTADRVFEFLPFAVISILSAVLILSWEIPVFTRIIVSVLIFLSLLIFGILVYAGLKREIAQRIIISLAKKIYPLIERLSKNPLSFLEVREKLIFYITRFSGGFITALRDKKVFIISFILSFIMWALDMLRMYVCFGSLGVYPPLVPIIIIYTVAILISLLPLLPGAWGIREATLIGLFAVVGIGADVVIAASLIDRLASFIAPTILGAVAALYYSRKVKNMKKISSTTA
jgi:uncharacterized protein (TIRG00374 family)